MTLKELRTKLEALADFEDYRVTAYQWPWTSTVNIHEVKADTEMKEIRLTLDMEGTSSVSIRS